MVQTASSIIFATGSYSGDDGNTRVQIFDLPDGEESGSWKSSDNSSELNEALVNVDAASGGLIDGTLYVVGGEKGLGGTVADTQAYNIAANEWEYRAPMATGVNGAADAVFGGRLYIFGGKSQNGSVSSVQVYDPEDDMWYEGPSFPVEGGTVMSAVAVTNRDSEQNGIYVFGGGSNNNQTWQYTPSNEPGEGSWETGLAPIPASRTEGGSAVVGRYVYLPAGARNGNESSRVVDRYNVDTDSWDQEPQKTPYSVGRSAHIVSDGESVYILGGGPTFTGKEDAVYRTEDDEWERLSGMKHGGADSAVVSPIFPGDSGDDDDSGTTEISASATTLQFIPGKSENPSEGGNPLDSGLMQVFEEGSTVAVNNDIYDSFDMPSNIGKIALGPVFDNWIGGDMTDALPTDLEEARSKKRGKYRDDVDRLSEFNQYRFENGIRISFESSDGKKIDKETIEIEFSESGPDGKDSKISRGKQENSKTVLHDSDLNGIPYEEWYGTNDTPSNRQRRYYEYDTEVKFEGVEGVRVMTIWGGYAGFMQDISNRVSDNPAAFFNTVWEWGLPNGIAKELGLLASPDKVQALTDFLTVVPNTFTFIDLVVLADGRRYLRVWDSSTYPSLAVYADGEQRELEKMPYKPRELLNTQMALFQLHASADTTPYQIPQGMYKAIIENESVGLRTGDEIPPAYREVLNDTRLTRPVPKYTLKIGTCGNETEDPDNHPFGSIEDIPLPLTDELDAN
ncbi:Kelch repeat-containing protein [Haloarcula amylolytica]|uniref:Attractin/MKLN-like beta-propeller domain-containing protein n=1 Tax=Haloarcula amylolytica JCM 13557 TaxID=1227452 RepID=M0K0D9_9EURY|nr:kelch repeat-containing protein [Haloarcula amylolytica]EMA14661.1 hypothetical protein C442_19876 [Haloarcula amylolytica JCM 13557]